jgi:hypothetical protein
MTDPIEAMAKALHPWLYSEYVDDQAARAAPLPAGGDGELVGWLRKFGPTAKTTTEQNLMDQAADRIAALNAEVARKDELIGKLLGAVSWLEPPFIDDSTAELELRLRIGFCVADKNRAKKGASPHDPRPAPLALGQLRLGLLRMERR